MGLNNIGLGGLTTVAQLPFNNVFTDNFSVLQPTCTLDEEGDDYDTYDHWDNAKLPQTVPVGPNTNNNYQPSWHELHDPYGPYGEHTDFGHHALGTAGGITTETAMQLAIQAFLKGLPFLLRRLESAEDGGIVTEQEEQEAFTLPTTTTLDGAELTLDAV